MVEDVLPARRQQLEEAAVELVGALRQELPPAFTEVSARILRDRRDLTLRVDVTLGLTSATEIQVDLDSQPVTVASLAAAVSEGLRRYHDELIAAAAAAIEAWEGTLGV